MRKATITVTFDADKLAAVKMYMEQKGLSFQDEMSKAAEALYGKYVPVNVREFIEMSAKIKPKPLKPRGSSVPSAEGDLD